MRRRQFIAGLGSTAAWHDPVTRAIASTFTQALAALGWTDGRNVRMDLRWGGGDTNRISAVAQQSVGLQPEMQTHPATIASRETPRGSARY